MGQSITVTAQPVDDFYVFTTDRSIGGQHGSGFVSAEAAAAATGFPARLAERLFATDPAIDHVYVASNDVIVRRAASWEPAAVETATATIRDLFRFYL